MAVGSAHNNRLYLNLIPDNNMFEDLTKKINLQNLNKIKVQHNRYGQGSDSSPEGLGRPGQAMGEGEGDREYEDSELDDLHIEYRKREQNFRRINQQEEQQLADFLKRDNSTPPSTRNLQTRLTLLSQKLALQRTSHEHELQYQQQLSKRREEWLRTEISKLKFLVKKHQLEEKELREMRNSLRMAEELREGLQGRFDELSGENRGLRERVDRLEREKAMAGEKESKEVLVDGNDKQKIQKLTTRIKQLQQDLQYEKSSTEQTKKKLETLNTTITKTKQSQLTKQKQHEDNIFRLQEAHSRRQSELQAQIAGLRKRNSYLEESFIEKMGEITRLQAHMLSGTVNVSQQSMPAQIVRHSSRAVEETINLHEESPIRPAPQPSNFTQKKPTKPSRISIQQQNNPEQALKPQPTNLTNQCLCCSKKIQKYKEKLEEANSKIIELLSQKVEGVRTKSRGKGSFGFSQSFVAQGSGRPEGRTKRCQKESGGQCCTRTRITSWHNPLA